MTWRLDSRLIRYELGLYARSGVLAALLAGAAVPWVFWLPDDVARRVPAALAMCETFVVAAAPFLLGGLISREHEERTADILFCRAWPRWRLIGLRFVIGVAAMAILIALPLVSYRLRGVAVPVGVAFATASAGAVFLAASSLAIGALTRSTAAAFLVPAAYWFFDWGTRGAHTGYLTLFARSLGKTWWPSSKLLLAALALVWLAVAVAATGRRR